MMAPGRQKKNITKYRSTSGKNFSKRSRKTSLQPSPEIARSRTFISKKELGNGLCTQSKLCIVQWDFPLLAQHRFFTIYEVYRIERPLEHRRVRKVEARFSQACDRREAAPPHSGRAAHDARLRK